MAKHSDRGTESMSGDLFDPSPGPKEQLAEKTKPGEGIGDSSLSPIETY